MYKVCDMYSKVIGIYESIEDFIRTYFFNESVYEDWKKLMRESDKNFDETNCYSREDFIQVYLTDAKKNTIYNTADEFKWHTYTFYKI